jgi:hypothetical protein
MIMIRITTAAVILCASFCRAEESKITNNASIKADPNVFCSITVGCASGSNIEQSTICHIKVINLTERKLWALNLPLEKLVSVDLIDTNGLYAKKTEMGAKYGMALTQKEVNDWFIPLRIAGHTSAAWYEVTPTFTPEIGAFRVLDSFSPPHAGEYTLKVRMRLIQSGSSDSAGTVRTNILDPQYLSSDRSSPIDFQSVWLPEVTSKVVVKTFD